MEKYILALDQGTSSSRAIVFDHEGNIRSTAQMEFTQYFPKPGWVEHNPMEIWSSEAAVIAEAITKMGINGKNIAGIGITNQRETTIVWDAETGEPVYNAIVWQDRRTASYCDELKAAGWTEKIRQKTGLIIDAGMSSSARSSGSQVNVLILNSIVREALETSVTWTSPRVSCQTSQLSTVPKRSLPASAFSRAPGTLSRIQRILVPEK